VFVGEGPGREEDRAGKPFVGEAGGLLTRIIKAMGLTREEVYICNVVKCRPPKNRDPRAEEIQACLPFLRRQIELIDPKVICTLGRVAGRGLLGREFSMSRDRGRWWRYLGIPVMPTFHPAYLLRNEEAKRPVWEDVKKIMRVLGLGVKRDG
jgi:DNA polymerase